MRRHWSTPHAAYAVMASAWLAGCGDGVGSDSPYVDPNGTVTPNTGATGPENATPPVDGTVPPGATGIDGMPLDPSAGGPGSPSANPTMVVGPDGTTMVPVDPPVTPVSTNCEEIHPGRAPLRRLTRFEYNNTVADLLDSSVSEPANALPPELLGNGFGNDADTQPVSFGLVEGYETAAREVVSGALANDARFSCVGTAAADNEAACTQQVLDTFATDAYRRALTADEAAELLTLQSELRANGTYQESMADLMSTILQGPDFLYRFEWGEPDPANPALRRPTGPEMAARLSYFLWGTMPDDDLVAAASSGELSTADGVRAQATRLLADQRSRAVIRYFFDHALPINGVAELARDPAQYPMFSGSIGAQMREETQRFLENEIFEGEGTWKSALTANYVFVNETLANYYDITNPDGSPITGDDYRRVEVDPQTTKRRGLLTQGAVLAGTTITNFTNPVRRGGFVVKELLCQNIPLPNDPNVLASVAPPEPFEPGQAGRETARMRYEQHRDIDAVCITCHAVLDPPGFALENYDAVGLWRDQENGVTIDATGDIALLGGAFDGPLELVDKIAETEQVYSCFSEHWTKFALGRNLDSTQDACLIENVEHSFVASGYDIQDLLLQLTQTDAFLYLPAEEQL